MYLNIDSIFVWVKSDSEIFCMIATLKLKKSIYEHMSEIVFAFVGANVKGNYKSIVISIKKKYEVVS